MFGLGGTEIIVIVIVALLFLGPDKLPEAAAKLSRGIRDLRKQTRVLQDTIEQDEKIGGAIRDLRSALHDEPHRPRPPAARPVPMPAGSTPAALPSPSAPSPAHIPGPTGPSTAPIPAAVALAPGVAAPSSAVGGPPTPADETPTVTPAADAVAKGTPHE